MRLMLEKDAVAMRETFRAVQQHFRRCRRAWEVEDWNNARTHQMLMDSAVSELERVAQRNMAALDKPIPDGEESNAQPAIPRRFRWLPVWRK